MPMDVSRRGVLASLLAEPEKTSWPVFGPEEEAGLLEVLRSGKWSRSSGGKVALAFEERYARLTGARFALATTNGTSALMAALEACDVGPGDAVLLAPFTFVATLNAVLSRWALPVFVDTDVETMEMDAGRLAGAWVEEAKVVMPVHLGGSAVDLDAVTAFAKAKKIRVIEDACQAHLGEWNGRKVGSVGDCGCFSFQASKNLNCGEGGAFITSDEGLYDRAHSFHNCGRARTGAVRGYVAHGLNLRMTDLQAALLVAQMGRIEEQARRRDENARYLAKMLGEIPGIRPQKMHAGCTRNAWHLFMFRCEERARLLKGLAARGVSASAGYAPLNQERFLDEMLRSKAWVRIYGERRLQQWRERNELPGNDRVCREAVWLTQTVLLGTRASMERIAEAVRGVMRG